MKRYANAACNGLESLQEKKNGERRTKIKATVGVTIILLFIVSIIPGASNSISVQGFQGGWPQTTNGDIYSSPAVGDIDYDGDLEVVIGSTDDNKVYAWHHNGTLVNGWPVTTGGGVYSSPALAAVDNDTDLEIFVGCNDGKMYAWHHDGTNVTVWPYQTSYELDGQTFHGEILSSPAIGDVDNDLDLEIAVGVKDIPGLQPDGREGENHFYVWHWIGTLVDGWPKSIPSPELYYSSDVYATPSLADMDNDGDLEIIFGSEGWYVWACHHDGTNVTGWPICMGKRPVERQAVVGDINKDGINEIVVIAKPGWEAGAPYNSIIHAFTPIGSEINGFPIVLDDGKWINAPPVIGDVNGDGYLEIVAAVEKGKSYPPGADLCVWRYDGSLLWSVRVRDEDNIDYNVGNGVVIADIDDDRKMEIIVGGVWVNSPTDNERGRVFAYNHDGSVASGFPKVCDPVGYSCITLCDLDQDGYIELVVGTETPHPFSNPNLGRVFVFDLPGKYNPAYIQWGMGYHDVRHTGVYIKPPTPVGGIWASVDKFGLLAPYIALASTIILAVSISIAYIKYRKKQ